MIPIAIAIGFNILSFVVMFMLLLEFTHIHKKRIEILEALHSSSIPRELKTRKWMMAFYVVLTFIISIVSSILIIWQPHLFS